MSIPLATYNYQEFFSKSSTLCNKYSLIIEGEISNQENLFSKFSTIKSLYCIVESLYDVHGPSFINQLEGNFSITLFDKEKKILYYYRDRLGTIPCYYFKTDHFFACSSSIRAILELPLVSRKMDLQAVGDYLSYGFVHAPKTLIQGINQLLPGHYLKLTDDEVTVQPYWSATSQFDYTIEGRTQEQQTFQVDRLFERFSAEALESTLDYSIDTPIADPISKAKLVDHPTFSSLTHLHAFSQQASNGNISVSTIGVDQLWGKGQLYEVLEGFQEHRWLLSWPKNMRNVISRWVSIPYKKQLQATYQQLIQQDYYDLDYLFPTYKRLYPIGPLQKSLDVSIEDAQKKIAQSSVVYQTEGFVYPYLSKVGFLELQTVIANAELPAIYQAAKLTGSLVCYPYLDQKLQRYLMHVPDEQKVRLRKRYKSDSKQQFMSYSFLDSLSVNEKNKLLLDFQSRSFVKGQLKSDLADKFRRLTSDKRIQLMEAIILLEIWLTENNIDE